MDSLLFNGRTRRKRDNEMSKIQKLIDAEYYQVEITNSERCLLLNEAQEELTAMQARIVAAEKLAEQLRCLRDFQQEAEARGQSSITVEVDNIFNSEDAAALEAWEALK